MADRIDQDTDPRERLRHDDEDGGLPESIDASKSGGEEEDKVPEDAGDDVEDELEKAREHADPSRGDKQVDGGDRVSTEKGGNPQE